MIRDRTFEPDLLTEITVRLVSGDDLGEFVPEERISERRDRCARCACRMIAEFKAAAAAGGIRELEGAGRRSYRRERRWRRRIEC